MEDKERRAKVADQLVGLAIGNDLIEAVLSRIEAIYYQDWLNRDERREAEVTRFEVIDHRDDSPTFGRAFTAHGIEAALLYQDDGKTLKVFINNQKKGIES